MTASAGSIVENPFYAERRYTVVYADPPWSYRDQAVAGKRGSLYKYALLSDKDVAALPVAQIAAENAALFLWVTWPKLVEVLPIIDAWGFAYRTVAFVWVKRTRVSGVLAWGMGSWTRANTEPCLLATRGKPTRLSAGVHQVVESRLGAHSEKPPEVRERIVKLIGDVPRIELFARHQAPGWDAWGRDLEPGGDSDRGPAKSSRRSSRTGGEATSDPSYGLFEDPEDDGRGDSQVSNSPAYGDRRRLVSAYVRGRQRVNRRDVAGELGITPEEASALLRRLVNDGVLRRRGQKRWTWYELPDDC